MQGQPFSIGIICIILFLADIYISDGIRGAFNKWHTVSKKQFTMAYLIFSAILTIGVVLCIYVKLPVGVRAGVMLVFFLLVILKVSFIPFVIADDIRRIAIRLKQKQKQAEQKTEVDNNLPKIPRSEFLLKAGLLAGSIPLTSLGIGIVSGAYDYKVKRQVLYLPNLPKAFDGLKLGQISDIHSGSFYNKKAVLGGVEMLLREKSDVIFFTGDLVNAQTSEIEGYQDIFSKVKAPLGVFSCLGNHDYGDYKDWPSDAAKRKNLDDMITTHKNLGWDLLRNENRRLKVDGEEIGILGVENWGALSRFPKYGRMDLAVKNTDDLPVKLLLSHDPSHWRAQVLPGYPQIDAMFSGHTHGMQFGVQTERFQWSPVQYIYKEWAGFYREANQQLYVNVGYGFLGFPGRVGILPEITIFELKAGVDPLLRG
jgi:predicted MPP superfamily phosphohydrolase